MLLLSVWRKGWLVCAVGLVVCNPLSANRRRCVVRLTSLGLVSVSETGSGEHALRCNAKDIKGDANGSGRVEPRLKASSI